MNYAARPVPAEPRERHVYGSSCRFSARFYDRVWLGFGPVKTGRDNRHNTASVPGMADKAGGAAGENSATGGQGIPWPGARSGAWNPLVSTYLPQLEISEEALNWALSLHSDQAPGDGHSTLLLRIVQSLRLPSASAKEVSQGKRRRT